MSSIQERLQLKRVPLDSWSIREQLCLASAVVKSEDQNWMSVSRSLKTLADPNRPSDWYSQKSCAAQYGALLENVDTPKRKKRNSEGAGETPQESILKRLTQERIIEIQKNVAELTQQYQSVKNELTEVRNPQTSEERLKELWTNIENAKKVREREIAKRAAWLKEREEKRARAERAIRPAVNNTGGSPITSPAVCPSSPLLTSLLKSSPVATTPQHIAHPASVVDTISPSAGAPTLSMLLEKTSTSTSSVTATTPTISSPAQHDNRHAAIEHIKSQLVQIEQQLKANPPTTQPQAQQQPLQEPLDIDDIEIKAEDVYAFRDVELEIQPVTAMHNTKGRLPDQKTPTKSDGQDKEESPADVAEEKPPEQDEVAPTPTEVGKQNIMETTTTESEPKPQTTDPEPKQLNIDFPDVKFPTPEIKVTGQDVEIKEEEKAPEPPQTSEQAKDNDTEVETTFTDNSESNVEINKEPEVVEAVEKAIDVVQEETVTPVTEVTADSNDATESEPVDVTATEEAAPKEIEQEEETHNEEVPRPDVEPETGDTNDEEERSLQDIKKEVDLEETTPLKDMKQDSESTIEEGKPGRSETEDHTETDDDTPMEVVREEEKDGKKKRDYSRKKKPESRTRSASDSAAEGADSPTVTEGERLHRLWKKSVMLVYNRLAGHKYASLFARPITDAEAPGYSAVVKRPMDLYTIKRNIDNGVVRSTAEFQRDVLLMLTNALMYNSREHRVYQMAKDMFQEAQSQLVMLVSAQAHAGLSTHAHKRPRRSRDISRH